jgi:coenzyme F420-0:L-glutamate ligase/coenzyme F420-1:gamma-L-glutamate ligase
VKDEVILELAQQTGRDPRLCQVYLNESTEILAIKGRHVVTRHRLGLICTAAGVDSSNVAPRAAHLVVLLPRDPDASARRIRSDLLTLTGKKVAVIINDSRTR